MEDIKHTLERAFPSMPLSFEEKMDHTLRELPAKPRRGKRVLKSALIACAALIFATACVIAVKPALAADIPLVNEIVYALSPNTAADEGAKANIIKTVSDVVNSSFEDSLESIGRKFKSGDHWVLNEDTLLAAYYLQYEGATLSLKNGAQAPQAADIEVSGIEAEARAFRYVVNMRISIMLGGKKSGKETLRVTLEDAASGMVITSMQFESADYLAYRDKIMAYQSARPEKSLHEEIANYNTYLIGQAIAQMGKAKAAVPTIPQTKEEKMADIAAELMYRFWLSRKTGEVPDLTGLIERNEDTEAFFLAADLNARMTAGRLISKAVMVEKGYGDIKEIKKKEGVYNVRAYVKTIIEGGVGEELLLRFKQEGEGYVIVSFNEIGDGVYTSLNRMAKNYKGLKPAQALRKVYEKWLDEIEAKSAMIEKNMREGMTEEEASQKALLNWADANK